MTEKVFAIDTQPGIQRDGTVFDMNFYTDGLWVRFQRGRPRKMGGYRAISTALTGYSRGIWVNPTNAINQVFSGHSSGLQELTFNNNGIGSGVIDLTLSDFTASSLNMWQFDGFYDVGGSGVGSLLAHPGQNLEAIDSTANTPVLIGNINGTTMSQIGVFSDSNAYLNNTTTVTLTSPDALIGPGQTVTGTGIPANTTVVSSGLVSTQLSNVTVTGTSGTFSCTATAGLFIGQTVTPTGSLGTQALVNVTVTGIGGTFSCNATTGLYVNQPIAITGSSSSGSGVATNTTYYIIATNGTSTFTLSTTVGGSAITTVIASLAGLVFTATNSIGLTAGTTYYIIATNYTTTFTLSATAGGSAVTTVVYSTSGFVFSLGQCTQVTLSNAATTTGNSTLTFNNNVSVSGGVVSLHPYVFVYGNNGLIKNCAAGNTNDWVSADANETNVASGKIVQGLPVRGGSNAPSGLFWSLDSVIRVSYVGGVNGQYWRYDIISSQSSIMSSQCVIEYDGIYYWVGVDRFLLYNGVVREIPNNFNQNYFFDNLNYNQRQKVWAQKVPRFGEIWWYFPSGNSDECNDAVIYNIRENCWYDAGGAIGARRTAGYFSQVFKFPVNAGATLSTQDLIFTSSIITQSTSVIKVPITNLIATGQLVVATGLPTNSIITTIAPSGTAGYYDVTLTTIATASATVTANFYTVPGQVILWQHEIGTDEVIGTVSNAIESSFQTSDLGWVAGGPSQAQMMGDNVWVHLERVEPDFIMTGEMTCQITGRPFAQSDDVTSDPYVFDATTGKIDMREQRREIRLIFTSNVQGGNYQLGKVLLSASAGDVRPY